MCRPRGAVVKNIRFLIGFAAGLVVAALLSWWSKEGRQVFAPQYIPVHNLTAVSGRKDRVLCMVTTYAENVLSKAVHVQATWGRRCDTLLFMSSESWFFDRGSAERCPYADQLTIIYLPVGSGRKSLWNKTKEGIRYVWEHYRDKFDWLLKADDDTYIVMENLREMLAGESPQVPAYTGHWQTYDDVNYMSGGAGYVLSWSAVKKLNEVGFHEPEAGKVSLCDSPHNSSDRWVLPSEDLQMGACLEMLKVKVLSSMLNGQNRFLPFRLESHLVSGLALNWFDRHTLQCRQRGALCVSPKVISFHYVEPKEMYNLEFLLYTMDRS